MKKEMIMQAKLITRLEGNPDKLQIVGVYEVSPPIDGNKFVILSSIDLEYFIKKTIKNFHASYSCLFFCETFIFPSDGKMITNFLELKGSQKGTMSHKKILEDLGYKVENSLS